MRRPTDAAPLQMKSEVIDRLATNAVIERMAKDIVAVEAGLARLAEHMAELRQEQEPYRWQETE